MNSNFLKPSFALSLLLCAANAENLAYDERLRLNPSMAQIELDKDNLPTSLTYQGKDTPLHSGDIARSMLLIPGFSVSSKGGAGSEISYRSHTASRLPIFINSGNFHGACPSRMDTAITYIFPQNYDKITILKGPQDVRYGALIGGGVLFDREIARFDKASFNAGVNALYGSFGRFDSNVSALAGGKYGSLSAIYSRYSSNDYKSGDGNFVHSAYKRESISLIGTLTPTSSTAIELDFDLSRGNASYADRALDARTFDRTSYNLRFNQKVNETLDSIDLRLYHNELDHIMDNFSYRQPNMNNGGMGNDMGPLEAHNPHRKISGTRLEGKFYFADSLELYIGGNYSVDTHYGRMQSGSDATSINNALFDTTRRLNMRFHNAGIYTQGTFSTDSSRAIAFGLRYDNLNSYRHSNNSTTNQHLGSGFVRYEWNLESARFYAGVGVAQRGADFWERFIYNAMNLNAETNSQLDAGAEYKNDFFSAKASAFASYIKDYILIHYTQANATGGMQGGMGGGTMRNSGIAFNTDAFLSGAELESKLSFFNHLHLLGSLSYTYAQNLIATNGLSKNSPIPQVSPLQARFSIFYENSGYILRLDCLANASQRRYVLNYGNVVGQDLGSTKGFYTLNLYTGYKSKAFSLLAGIDNITDTFYAYHISRNGVAVQGYTAQTNRVYEPGRSLWVRASVDF